MVSHMGLLNLIIIGTLLGYGLSEVQRCTVEPIPPNAKAHVIFVSSQEGDCKTNSGRSQLVENARTILEGINLQQTTKFGLQVVPMCSNSLTSRLRVAAEISRQLPVTDSCSAGVEAGVANRNSTLVGVISSGQLDMQQILAGTGIPLVTIGETAAAPAENVYQANNHLSLRAKAIAELAVTLNWDYTSVVYGSDPTSQALKLLLEKQLEENLVCVDEFVMLSESTTGAQMAKSISGSEKPHGIIFIGAPDKINVTHKTTTHLTWIVSPSLPEQENFKFTSNPFDTVHILKQYQSNSSDIANLDQMALALHAISKSVQTVIDRRCSGSIASCNNLGLAQLHSLTNRELKSVEIHYDEMTFSGIVYENRAGSFRFVNQTLQHEPLSPIYRLSSAIEGMQVEYSLPDGWNLNSTSQDRGKFWCTNENCRTKCSQQITPKNYIYVPGDYIIVVTEPIHNSFNKYPDLWSCTEFNNETSLRAEAALYARDRLNILLNGTGFNFGLLVLDTCYNTALTQKLLTDVLNGTTEYCYKGDCLDRSKIIGLVGDYSSHISITEQRLMMPANLLQVSYGASTAKLDDKTVYTHFLRTHPTATRSTGYLIQILDSLNEKKQANINAVVLIHTNSLYGASGEELLRTKLNDANYCIQETFELNYFATETPETHKRIWSTLQKYAGDPSFVVIYNGEEKPIRDLLDAMGPVDINWWKSSGSIFLMTEVWDDRLPLIDKYGNLLRGSLTFKLTPDFGITGFEKHLQDLRPDSSDRNPWFPRLYQRQRACKVRGSFETSYSTICSQDQSYVGEDGKINIEIYSLYTIKSVYALGYGFWDYAKATTDCEGGLGNCDTLYERTIESSQSLKLHVGKVRIPMNDTSSLREGDHGTQPFDNNLDGRSGFEVYSQQKIPGTSKHRYAFVYAFNGEKNLSIPNDDVPVFYVKEEYTDKESKHMLHSRSCEKQCERYCSPSTTGISVSTEPPGATPDPHFITKISIPMGIVIFVLLIVVIALTAKKYRRLSNSGGREEESRLAGDGSKRTVGSDSSSTYMNPDRDLPSLPFPDHAPASTPLVTYRDNSQRLNVPRLMGPGSVIDSIVHTNYTNNRMSVSSLGKYNDVNYDVEKDGSKSDHSLSILCFGEKEDPIYTLPTEPIIDSSLNSKPTPLPRQNSQEAYADIGMSPSP